LYLIIIKFESLQAATFMYMHTTSRPTHHMKRSHSSLDHHVLSYNHGLNYVIDSITHSTHGLAEAVRVTVN